MFTPDILQKLVSDPNNPITYHVDPQDNTCIAQIYFNLIPKFNFVMSVIVKTDTLQNGGKEKLIKDAQQAILGKIHNKVMYFQKLPVLTTNVSNDQSELSDLQNYLIQILLNHKQDLSRNIHLISFLTNKYNELTNKAQPNAYTDNKL
jgi:hypothetical protein